MQPAKTNFEEAKRILGNLSFDIVNLIETTIDNINAPIRANFIKEIICKEIKKAELVKEMIYQA